RSISRDSRLRILWVNHRAACVRLDSSPNKPKCTTPVLLVGLEFNPRLCTPSSAINKHQRPSLPPDVALRPAELRSNHRDATLSSLPRAFQQLYRHRRRNHPRFHRLHFAGLPTSEYRLESVNLVAGRGAEAGLLVFGPLRWHQT